MEGESAARTRWPAFLLSGLLCVAAGAGGAYVFMRRVAPEPKDSAATSPGTPGEAGRGAAPDIRPMEMAASATPLPDVVVPLTEEAVARAGIEVATVGTSSAAS